MPEKRLLGIFCLFLVCKCECEIAENPNVSVIVPVFNGQLTIVRCIKSILKQTLRNVEIICVDDGSADRTLEILKQFAERDNRLVVIHQENKGEGNACNTGLLIARGEYVTFVHADDWIEFDYYEVAFKKLKDYDADVAVVGHNKCIPKIEEIKRGVDASKKFLLFHGKNCYQWHVYDKLYRSLLIKNNNVTFNGSVRYGVDTLFNFDMLPFVESVLFINKTFYHAGHLTTGVSMTRTFKDIQLYVDAVNSSCMRMMINKKGYKYTLTRKDFEIIQNYIHKYKTLENKKFIVRKETKSSRKELKPKHHKKLK